MIVALFALAILMIVGGSASVIQGFPFVRLESGLAMTIAGAGTASAGAILLGLAVVATRLRRLEQVMAEQEFGFRPEVDRAPAEPAAMLVEPAGPAAVGEPEAPVGRQRPSLGGPRVDSPPRFAEEPRVDVPPGSDPAAPLLPDLLPDPPPEPPRPAAVGTAPDVVPPPRKVRPEKPQRQAKPIALVDTVIPVPAPTAEATSAIPVPVPAAAAVAPPRRSEPEEEPLGLRPSFAGEPDSPPPPDRAAGSSGDPVPAVAPEPVPAPVPAGEPAPAEGALQVVGTYASGGNTYVMFSNGSIEADTPRGQFTFDSLDELKAFVEGGGEDGARGAA